MALTVTDNLSEWDDCDTDNWTGDPTVGLDADFQREGTGCIGIDVDIETHRMFGASKTSTSLSSTFICAQFLSFSASTLDTKSAGGIQICVEDSSGNQSCWYVGGSDNYRGGWELFGAHTSQTPDWNNGTAATLTDIVKMGAGFKNTAKSKLSQNCFVDWMRYGSGAAFTVSGSNTTAGAGWSEVASLDNTATLDYVKPIPGGYLVKTPFQIGDSAGTATTDFSDYSGDALVFDNQKVGDAYYGITVAGNGTGTTDVQIGSVVGSGDSRQGVAGGSIKTLGPAWEWDSATDIADLDTVYLYGAQWTGAESGIALDDNTKTSAISMTFTNCGEIAPGSTNNGAEMLSCFIIDPTGTANNYGVLFGQTPSAGTLTHNLKKLSFITSGTPSTQYMTRFTYTGDYAVTWQDFNFYGDFSSGTLWHGLNSGTNADITIGVTGTGNASASEFSSTASGTVTVTNNKTLLVTVKDAGGTVISGASVAIYDYTGGVQGSAIVSPTTTNASGQVSDSYNYSGDLDVIIRVRKSSTGTRYVPVVSPATITTNGLNVTITLIVDGNVS